MLQYTHYIIRHMHHKDIGLPVSEKVTLYVFRSKESVFTIA
jgi:hypothetical protein